MNSCSKSSERLKTFGILGLGTVFEEYLLFHPKIYQEEKQEQHLILELPLSQQDFCQFQSLHQSPMPIWHCISFLNQLDHFSGDINWYQRTQLTKGELVQQKLIK
jgi:hypothetical protein